MWRQSQASLGFLSCALALTGTERLAHAHPAREGAVAVQTHAGTRTGEDSTVFVGGGGPEAQFHLCEQVLVEKEGFITSYISIT